MKIFLTGKPGIGKTTAIKRFIELCPEGSVLGFYTQEIREKGKRVGFELITTWGERFVLAHVDIEGPRVSRYGVDVGVMEKVVDWINAVSSGKIIIVDEVGKMELLCGKFVRWVESLLKDKDVLVVGTVPLRSSHPVVNRIKKNFPVWEVTRDNRDAIPFRIKDYLSF